MELSVTRFALTLLVAVCFFVFGAFHFVVVVFVSIVALRNGLNIKMAQIFSHFAKLKNVCFLQRSN